MEDPAPQTASMPPLAYETPPIRRRRPWTAAATVVAALLATVLGVPLTLDACVAVAQPPIDAAAVVTAAIGIISLTSAGMFACQAFVLIRDLRRGP